MHLRISKRYNTASPCIPAVSVNLLSLSYMFLYLPGTLLTSWMMQKVGETRRAVLV